MKKICLLFLILFLIIPFVLADITIKSDQHIYNLGNKIRPSASVLYDKNFEGFFKMTLVCGNYKLPYFLTPISLEANFRTAVNVPELTVTPQMLGNCTIIGDLTTDESLLIETQQSNSFEVTDQLIVLPINSKISALPSEQIQISAVVNEAFGNNVIKASATAQLDNSSYSVDVIDGKFNLTLELPRNIKSATHIVELSVIDSKINTGKGMIKLEVIPVPNYIKLELSATLLNPGSRIQIVSSLFDQADDLINVSLDLELIAPKEEKVFRKTIYSSDPLEYELSQYAQPGTYMFKSTYKNLAAQATVDIASIREVKIKYQNESVLVENIGNIPFIDEMTFILQGELKKYLITKKIEIEPGKFLSIDLSKEVPLGIYDVISPLKEGLEPVKNVLGEVVDSLQLSQTVDESLLASDVTIHDNRPLYKRVGTTLSSLSGSIVGANGILAKNPFIAPIVLLVILLLIVFRYGRKPIMNLFKRKKDDEDKKEN